MNLMDFVGKTYTIHFDNQFLIFEDEKLVCAFEHDAKSELNALRKLLETMGVKFVDA